MSRERDLRRAIAAAGFPVSDRAVWGALLNRADFRTADLPPKYTPRQKVVARDAGVSVRQVKYSVAHLKLHGWLVTGQSPVDARRLIYRFRLGQPCDCTGRRHVTGIGATPQVTASIGATPQVRAVDPADSEIGATTAPNWVQPIGATPQVRACADPMAGKGEAVTEVTATESEAAQPRFAAGWRWGRNTGPCDACSASIERYGPNGRRLCDRCRDALAADVDSWARRSLSSAHAPTGTG